MIKVDDFAPSSISTERDNCVSDKPTHSVLHGSAIVCDDASSILSNEDNKKCGIKELSKEDQLDEFSTI